MKLILIGQIASGKGTYASRLSQVLGVPHISTGQLFRGEIERGTEIGKKVQEIYNQGKWCSDDITMEIVKRRLAQTDAKKGFIFDGFPRTIPQAEALEKITSIDAVILLKVPEWISIKRITSRRTCAKCGEIYNLLFLKPKVEGKCDKCGSELVQRQDETEEGTKQRMKEFENLTAPVIYFYRKRGLVKEVENNDIETPPEPIVNKILEALGREERI